jgi:hypothetical protein
MLASPDAQSDVHKKCRAPDHAPVNATRFAGGLRPTLTGAAGAQA